MIIPSRSYERRPPFRDARKVFIVCEGNRREYNYFSYFQEIDSRIDIQIHELDPHENNSPAGLLALARELDIKDFDEIWIVLDRDPDKLDSRGPQIESIRKACAAKENLDAAVSNPCFEVWLYYHHYRDLPDFEGIEISTNWKRYLNESIPGGFDCRKQPLLIESATDNSKANFQSDSTGEPIIGSTQVYKLASSMLPLVLDRINERKIELEL